MAGEAEKAEELKAEGNKQYALGNWQSAVDFYSRAIEFSPNATYYSNRAACNIKLKDWTSGLKDCEMGLALNSPNRPPMGKTSAHVKLYWRKGVCEKELDKLDAARDSFTKGLKIDPDNAILKEELSKLSWLLKQASREARARRRAPVTVQRRDIPVKIVDTLPKEWREQEDHVVNSLPSVHLSIDPKTPLTLQFLTQLVRTPPGQRGAVYDYLFSTEASVLPRLHGQAGVEHDTVEFYLDAIVEEHKKTERDSSLRANWAQQSVAILENLLACNRFSIAQMFVSTDKIRKVFALLETGEFNELQGLREKWC